MRTPGETSMGGHLASSALSTSRLGTPEKPGIGGSAKPGNPGKAVLPLPEPVPGGSGKPGSVGQAGRPARPGIEEREGTAGGETDGAPWGTSEGLGEAPTADRPNNEARRTTERAAASFERMGHRPRTRAPIHSTPGYSSSESACSRGDREHACSPRNLTSVFSKYLGVGLWSLSREAPTHQSVRSRNHLVEATSLKSESFFARAFTESPATPSARRRAFSAFGASPSSAYAQAKL